MKIPQELESIRSIVENLHRAILHRRIAACLRAGYGNMRATGSTGITYTDFLAGTPTVSVIIRRDSSDFTVKINDEDYLVPASYDTDQNKVVIDGKEY
jgi:hypothetical protein